MQAIARLWGIFLLVCFIDAFRINISSGRCATRKVKIILVDYFLYSFVDSHVLDFPASNGITKASWDI